MVYEKVSKFDWTCVAGHLGILCTRKSGPVQGVHFFSENSVKLVDAKCDAPIQTETGRVHTICKFGR